MLSCDIDISCLIDEIWFIIIFSPGQVGFTFDSSVALIIIYPLVIWRDIYIRYVIILFFAKELWLIDLSFTLSCDRI